SNTIPDDIDVNPPDQADLFCFDYRITGEDHAVEMRAKTFPYCFNVTHKAALAQLVDFGRLKLKKTVGSKLGEVAATGINKGAIAYIDGISPQSPKGTGGPADQSQFIAHATFAAAAQTTRDFLSINHSWRMEPAIPPGAGFQADIELQYDP